MLLTLAAISFLAPFLSDSECARTCEAGENFEAAKGEGGCALAKDILTPNERISTMAKITAIIELQKDFMVFANLEDVFYLLDASCNDEMMRPIYNRELLTTHVFSKQSTDTIYF